MAKALITYIILIVGLMILFNIAGIIDGGLVGQLKASEKEGLQKFQDFDFWKWFEEQEGKIALGAVGIVVGVYLAKLSGETVFSAAIATGLLGVFIGDLISIAVKVSGTGNWTDWIAIMLLSPIIFGYAITLWDWIRGRD